MIEVGDFGKLSRKIEPLTYWTVMRYHGVAKPIDQQPVSRREMYALNDL